MSFDESKVIVWEFQGPCTAGRVLFLHAVATKAERLPEDPWSKK